VVIVVIMIVVIMIQVGFVHMLLIQMTRILVPIGLFGLSAWALGTAWWVWGLGSIKGTKRRKGG
jgi:hypothetical protein